jgi:hypothetical protein
MERQIMWSQWNEPGLEHFRLVQRGDEIVADGVVIGVENDTAFRLRYQVRCDSQWRVREVKVDSLDAAKNIRLTTNGEGLWFDESGKYISMLDGCIDIDITATPFTNTLPIVRLAIKKGESIELTVAYIVIPEMQLTLDKQRYTHLGISSFGSRYKFESVNNDFTADLPTDSDGLVEDYPKLFRRVWSR